MEDGKQKDYFFYRKVEHIVAGKELVCQWQGEKEWLLLLRFGEFGTILIK